MIFNNFRGGFIALIPAIALSLILILVAVIMSQSGFLTRQIISESESKERSAALAEACVDNAMLFLIQNPAYAGNQTIPIDTESCFIRAILFNNPIAGQNTIETKGIKNEATTNIRAVINTSNSSVVSWDEIVSF